MRVFQGALCAMAWVNGGLNLQLYRPLEPEQPWLPAGARMLMKFWHPSASHRDMTHPWWAKAQTEPPLPARGCQLYPFPGADTHEPGRSLIPGMVRQIQSWGFAFSGSPRLGSSTATTTVLPF